MIEYKDLRFADDFMFCWVLSHSPELCKELVEIATDRKVRKIHNLTPQLSKKDIISGKGVRFDVSFDGDDMVYDFETQTTKKADLSKRTRYYQSMIDRDHLHPGDEYKKIPDSSNVPGTSILTTVLRLFSKPTVDNAVDNSQLVWIAILNPWISVNKQ